MNEDYVKGLENQAEALAMYITVLSNAINSNSDLVRVASVSESDEVLKNFNTFKQDNASIRNHRSF